MRVSTKGRYGLRAMLDLAMYRRRNPIPLKRVAARQEISMDYLEQLLRKLKKAGLVRSVRGPKGGFALARDPRDITVLEILEALGENLAPAHCAEWDNAEDVDCQRAPSCVARVMWKELWEHQKSFLRGRTLEDLCSEARKICPGAPPEHNHVYYI